MMKNAKKIKPYVGNLGNMMTYQDGSVVSRTIIRKKAGTITMFAFDKGQGLPEHAVPYDAILYITEGKMDVMVEDGEPIPCNAGEMAYMPADIPHSVVGATPCKMFLIMIRSRDNSIIKDAHV